jgi:hypothetical protein
MTETEQEQLVQEIEDALSRRRGELGSLDAMGVANKLERDYSEEFAATVKKVADAAGRHCLV